MEVKREMVKTSHLKEDGGWSNRFVPAVCGVTIVPDELDLEMVSIEKELSTQALTLSSGPPTTPPSRRSCRGCPAPTLGIPFIPWTLTDIGVTIWYIFDIQISD